MRPSPADIDLAGFWREQPRVIPASRYRRPTSLPAAELSHLPVLRQADSAFAASGNRCMVRCRKTLTGLARAYAESKARAYFPMDKLAFFDEAGGVRIGDFQSFRFDRSSLHRLGPRPVAAIDGCSFDQPLPPCPGTAGGETPAQLRRLSVGRRAADVHRSSKYWRRRPDLPPADHVFVPQRAKVDEFVRRIARRGVGPCPPAGQPADFTSVIDDRAFSRVTRALEKAQERGAYIVQLVPGPRSADAATLSASHRAERARRLRTASAREIFRTVLPVIPYPRWRMWCVPPSMQGPRPLAFYPFSNDKQLIRDLIHRVTCPAG